jgi:hypothetical protein
MKQLDMIDPTTSSFNEGYQVGLTWDADWVPGGPSVYHATSRYVSGQLTDEQKRRQVESEEHARLWMLGWKHGMTIDPNKMITKFLRWSKERPAPKRCVEVFGWVA